MEFNDYKTYEQPWEEDYPAVSGPKVKAMSLLCCGGILVT